MSSPIRPGMSVGEELEYYKKQYEQLETDLAEFQTSSKELEEQLEKDIDAAEKKERKLREQVEKITFEVEEWKTKHRQAKAEANSAQNALQKEITTMRDSHRTLQLKLRDIEVMNDDYERQARNTESSLEDLESKYNVAIERSVLLEEEIKVGEKERETLRIETQRLRDELSDLKVENEITLEKLRLANETAEQLRSRKPSPLAVESLRAKSPGSEASGMTPSSPTASTPPPRSDTASEAPTPPSPPLSDGFDHVRADVKNSVTVTRKRPTATDAPGIKGGSPLNGARTVRHVRGPSLASSQGTAASDSRSMRPPAFKPRTVSKVPERLPRSDSLYQIKALRGRMQKIEERVHSARSKLPPANPTTPKGSPRHMKNGSEHIPASVTLRRTSRRPTSITSSSIQESETDSHPEDRTARRESYVKRLSFGIPRPASSASRRDPERPPSALDRPPSAMDRPPSAAASTRPQSRTSLSAANTRPGSRTGARTPMDGFHPITSHVQPSVLPSRPRSSMSGDHGQEHTPYRTHRPSASVSELRRMADESADASLRSPTSLQNGFGLSARGQSLHMATTLPRRQSGGIPQYVPPRMLTRRESGLQVMKEHGQKDGATMRPPASTTASRNKTTDVGETY